MSEGNGLRLYCNLMSEIKRRDQVIRSLLQGTTTTLYPMTNIESIYLQIRKILDLIALGSIVANKKEYSKQHAKFQNHYNAKFILNNLKKINPDFYPKPVKETRSDQSGIASQWQEYDGRALSKDDFVKLYERCGSLLHSQNPYGKNKNITFYKNNIEISLQKIVGLLNSHTVQLLSGNLYLIHMKKEGHDQVRGYIFAKVAQNTNQE
ncbi:MAG: hypothetical protein PHX58_07670 [Desulfovibrio sp.]|nr:hypothetical protein [Desulfovibrio sp.]